MKNLPPGAAISYWYACRIPTVQSLRSQLQQFCLLVPAYFAYSECILNLNFTYTIRRSIPEKQAERLNCGVVVDIYSWIITTVGRSWEERDFRLHPNRRLFLR
jgi:hypothetical protein